MSTRRNTMHNVPCKIEGVECTAIAWVEETELIKLDSMYPESDPTWRYLDKAGHMHRPKVRTDAVGQEYVTVYPTLDAVYEPPWYCHDCREEHSFITHYECSQCRETIKPRTRPPTTSWLEGPRSAWLKVICYDLSLIQGENRNDFLVEIEHKRYHALRGDVLLTSGEPATVTFHIVKPLEGPDGQAAAVPAVPGYGGEADHD